MKSVINFSLNATYNIMLRQEHDFHPKRSNLLFWLTQHRTVESNWISNRRKEGERKREVRREKEGGKSGEKTKTKYESIKERSNKGKNERSRMRKGRREIGKRQCKSEKAEYKRMDEGDVIHKRIRGKETKRRNACQVPRTTDRPW